MTISSIGTTSPTTTPAAPAATPNAAVTGLGSDFKTFLTLLTNQLKNQDPTAPIDANQFTSQLVSFAQVEQAIDSNTKLANLVALQSTDQTLTALPLVGHTIQYSDNQTALVNGTTTFGYDLPATAANTSISINDANGRTVFQTSGETGAGFHSFTWNGAGTDGSTQPDGVYTFNVGATAADKSSLTPTLTSFGKVSSVNVANGAASLNMGGVNEPLSKIVAITN